jgi:serine/threonine protein kinase
MSQSTNSLPSHTTGDTLSLQGQPGTEATNVPAAPLGYELRDEIGRGGMAIVYRALDLSLRREVAVKVLNDRYSAHSGADLTLDYATIERPPAADFLLLRRQKLSTIHREPRLTLRAGPTPGGRYDRSTKPLS